MRDWKKEVRERLVGIRLRPEREAEIVEELSGDLQYMYDELRAQGFSEEQAVHDVIRELDSVDLSRELRGSKQTHYGEPLPEGGASSGRWISDLLQDLRYAVRMLRKNPGFAIVACLTLGLGIGANTAVFTIVNTFLLNPLPVHQISELVAIDTTGAKKTAESGDLQPLSFLNLKDVTERARSFSSLAGHSNSMAVTMSEHGASHRVFMELATAGYFDTLGIHPFIGRFFLPSEDVTPGAAPVVVLGYGAWQTRFGGVPNILGRTIKLNDTTFTIVGIAPQGFKGVYAVFGPDLWAPSTMAQQLLPAQQQSALSDRAMPVFTGIGRLKPGTTFAQAQAEMKVIGSALEKEYPDANQGERLALRTLTEAAFGPERQAVVLGSSLLMAIVGIVLLIACSNVANLLLSRAAVRRQEIAVRMALGAGRVRLLRQLLTESVLLGLLSGVFGLLLAYFGCQLLMSLRPVEYAQNLFDLKISGNVYAFAFVTSLLTGLIFGIVPALRSSRASVSDALKEATRTVGRIRGRVTLANVLLAGQVATSLLLLVVASLFLRSIEHEYTIDPGFQTAHLALFMPYPGQAGYSQQRATQFYRDARDRVAGMPGVASVTWASNLPLWGRKETGIVIEDEEQRTKSEAISAVINTIDLDYFSTLGIPFREGRDFTQSDTRNEQLDSDPVAIINETMAATYWPGQDALGKRFELPGGKQFLKVIGIVKTANYGSLGEPPQSCAYIPLRQNYSDDMILYVRTERDPSTILSAVQAEVQSIDPGLPVEDIRTGTKVMAQALWWAKIGVGMLSVFGLLALGLATVGLYGIMAYSVSQRRQEIGVRMALGAGEGQVALLILRQGMVVVLGGATVGLVLALLVGRAFSRFLYGVSGVDPLSIAGATLVLLVVAFGACYLPAKRASRLDPLAALRQA
jgi:macrolide transport system ATP-binding/permease protein